MNYYNSSNNITQSHYDSSLYFDYYTFATNQKTSMIYECFSLFLIMIYSFKYFQILSQSNLLYYVFNKVSREYFFLFIIIIICFVGLSLCTYYIFGQHIYEYQHFLETLHTNFKIFILGENSKISSKFLIHNRSFSIAIFFTFLFLIRYFLLGLFYPIMIERYMIESENFLTSNQTNQETEEFTFIDRKYICK